MYTQPAITESVKLLSRDMRKTAATLSQEGARYVVDAYYQIQEYRKRAKNQVRAAQDEPVELIDWMSENFHTIEKQIKAYLDYYAESAVVGRWAKSIMGIGPVISAGLMAHIDIKKAPTAGHIWSFAGINPNQEWKKGTIRPWNAQLKVLCWKIGQSFVKVHNNDKDVYGKLYIMRKNYEQKKNEAGEYAEQARRKLERFKIGKNTDAYKSYSIGKLPPAHIDQRSQRYATKIFLSHWHKVAYFEYHRELPPKPFAIDILNHAHEIECPNWPF